jgi:diketogulonate reductase-like aldo/keto reductase
MPTPLTLSNGVTLPAVGLGVFQTAAGEVTQTVVRDAIAAGYRHIDTAQVYRNEADVGAAIASSGLGRSEVFVTTKVGPKVHGFDAVLESFEASEQKLGRIDLLLVHWPVEVHRLAAWKALEKLYRDGRVRAIGVSNFLVSHLDELERHAEILPHVNQIEVHPFHQQRATRAWCAARSIAIEAYSPLTRGQKLLHPVVVDVARRLGCTPAQALLRWGLDEGMAVLPKSVRPERMAENLAVDGVVLDPAAKAALDGLEEATATGWDPRTQR